MNSGWKMFLDRRDWYGGMRLFIRNRDHNRRTAFVLPFHVQVVAEGAAFETPTLQQTYEEGADNIGDVDGFLQAALDCAWEAGLRPTGFADHTNELAAVRYHLEDMRLLAKVPLHLTRTGGTK